MNAELLIATAEHERESLPKDWTCPVVWDMSSLMVVIGALQLSLRHPQFRKSRTGKAIRDIVDKLITGIPEDCPATRELAKLGNNPKHDV